MADKSKLEQMLESLVNDDQAKAEELFHEYVVEASREIYESLIESEMSDEEDEDEEVEEGMDSDEDEEDVEEGFEDIAIEADDEMGGDPTDDLEGDLDAEMGDEMGGEEEMEKGEEELFQDLEAIVDELQAKFDELKGIEQGEHGDEFGDEEGGDEGGFGDEEDVKDDFDLATVREYVEKVADGHGAEKKGKAEQADGSSTGLKFSKNDMGGTTANILSGRDGATGGDAGAAGGALKGKPLSDTKAKEDNAGNINVPGAKNGNAFSKKEPGHGAEKKGAAEKGADTASLFRGRR